MSDNARRRRRASGGAARSPVHVDGAAFDQFFSIDIFSIDIFSIDIFSIDWVGFVLTSASRRAARVSFTPLADVVRSTCRCRSVGTKGQPLG
jgi:hypothetical protein